MIRIAITGTPGSCHRAVGESFAERMDIPYVCAQQFASKWCTDNSVNYYMYKQHYSEAADAHVDACVTEAYKQHERNHLVIDTYTAVDKSDCIRMLITSSIVDTPELARSLYEESLLEIKATQKPDLYIEENYDMSFPSTYMPISAVLDTIASTLRNGVFKGHYLHPYQVLPLYTDVKSLKIPEKVSDDYEFSVTHFGQCYYLTNPDQYGAYLWHLQHLRRMRVLIDHEKLLYNQFSPIENYNWLAKALPENVFLRLELCNSLARYAARFDVVDHDQLYLDLSRNANPLRVLREGGF